MPRLSPLTVLAVTFAFTSLMVAESAPQSDPQALALAAKSIALLTGGTPVTDVTLTANVTRSLGPDKEIGSGTFLAKGSTMSRIDLSLGAAKRSDIRNSVNGAAGTWSGDDGKPVAYASHNCWSDDSWFFLALSSLSATDSSVVLSYIGLEKRGDASVQHIRSYRPGDPFIQQLSVMDFYLDAASLLPIAISFNVHPDNDELINIPVEVEFSDYQPSNELLIPSHIQQYLQGGLVLDVVFTNVVVNSGLLDSDFSIQ